MGAPKKRRWWILLVVLILIAILCLVGLLFIRTASYPPPTVQPLLTTAMQITITSARITSQTGSTSFVVPANRDLTLQSTDSSSHKCTISGNGQNITVQLSGGNVSSSFKLPLGKNYRLTCDSNPNRFISINAE